MLKKLFSTVFLTATLLLPSFAFSDEIVTNDIVYSSNVLGLLPVYSNAKRTIIAVPWCAMSETDDLAIQVSNVVKTANLTEGDTLHAYNGQSFDSWRLEKGADKILYWQSVNQVAENGTNTTTESSATFEVSRGMSVMLIRQNPTDGSGNALPFYLYGQVGTNSIVTSTITHGGVGVRAYSLISNPNPVDWNPNDDNVTWTGVNSEDTIQVNWADGNNDILSYKDGVWGYYAAKSVTKYGRTSTSWVFTKYETEIPAGQGVWYISNSDGSSVSWSGVPTK